MIILITPRAHAQQGGSWCLYIIYCILSALFFWNQSFISQNTHFHAEVHFNTDMLLIEFNGLWYSLATRQVSMAIANPVSLSFDRKIPPAPPTPWDWEDQVKCSQKSACKHCTSSKPHPYDSRYRTKMVEHAYSSTGTWHVQHVAVHVAVT